MKFSRRWWRRSLLVLGMVFLLPVLVSVIVNKLSRDHRIEWWQARADSTDQAPDPVLTRGAVVQVYAARAARWRGAFGVHTWIAVKPAGTDRYTRFEVMGWGVRRGRPAVRMTQTAAPDGYWFGSKPQLLVDLRGSEAARLIARISQAVREYPHPHEYSLWPGPNSNTFIAYIGRRIPELKLHLPPTAIGKDYIAGGGVFARSPGGSGIQFSLYGLLGLLVGVEEGIELNLLGLSAGIDWYRPALKLPGIGRLGFESF